MIDGHMHLEMGELTSEYVLKFVEQAKQKGLTTIQILDHTHRFKEFEIMYEELKQYPIQKKWLENKEMKFKNTLEEYQELINEVKAMNLGIEVLFGLEVCYVPKYKDYIASLLQKYNYDFVVGAIHSIDGILYDMGFSKQLLWDVYDTNKIYERYYKLVFDLVESNLFTQLAHPDTIKLFNYYPTYDLKETYTELTTLLNKHNMKAENNTGCFYRYKHKDMGLSDDLLTIFKQNNVAMICASDAHKPEDVGSYIKEIYPKTMSK